MLRQLRSFAANFALFCFSCLLMVGFAEFAVRTWAPRETSVPWQDDMNGVICMRPNVHGLYRIPKTFDVRMNTLLLRRRFSVDAGALAALNARQIKATWL